MELSNVKSRQKALPFTLKAADVSDKRQIVHRQSRQMRFWIGHIAAF
jgi:hypothetical protein